MGDGPQRWSLEEYRAYLRVLARMRLTPELRAMLDSSDVIQQTMAKAWEKRDQFRGQTEAEYRGWLRRILAHEVYDRAKRDGLIQDDPARKVSLEQALDESGRGLDAALALDSGLPPEKLIQRETLVRLEKALEQLPPNQREAVELHKLQGLSVAETGRRMDRSAQAVAGLLVRAMRTLRQLLDDLQ